MLRSIGKQSGESVESVQEMCSEKEHIGESLYKCQLSLIHKVTVKSFCSTSVPVDFCRHLVGKKSEKCLSLW